ncbi:hypothetical protein [Vibrio hippocampi]|uniref:Uncharacterized protein n=1 Tax=Vibrio hippocampi TaxID=654686 RepID=A0ABM8ZLZ9_9VIBR|nr:hypothetical protein [Vibrio hippocampi]CAH0529560.1 hypothetical protein VHP8226_03315 [Vibrio hippocampi]
MKKLLACLLFFIVIFSFHNFKNESANNNHVEKNADSFKETSDTSNAEVVLEVSDDSTGVEANNNNTLISSSRPIVLHSKNNQVIKDNLMLAHNIGWELWLEKFVNGEIKKVSEDEFDSLIAIAIGLQPPSFIEKVTNYGFEIPEKSILYLVNAKYSDSDTLNKLALVTNSDIVLDDKHWEYLFKTSIGFGHKEVAVHSLQQLDKIKINKQEIISIIERGRSSNKDELYKIIQSL